MPALVENHYKLQVVGKTKKNEENQREHYEQNYSATALTSG